MNEFCDDNENDLWIEINTTYTLYVMNDTE